MTLFIRFAAHIQSLDVANKIFSKEVKCIIVKGRFLSKASLSKTSSNRSRKDYRLGIGETSVEKGKKTNRNA